MALGLVGVTLVLFAPALLGEVGCDTPALLTILAACVATSTLVVRLPRAVPISLLAAVLLPSWFTCGGALTAGIALVASLIGALVRTRTALPAGLSAAGALAGALVGNLLGVAIVASEWLGPWATERIVAGAGFMAGYWLGELSIWRLAQWRQLIGDVSLVPRSNLVANLLVLFPGTVLADLLATRGLLLFGPMLLLLLVALALIALYLSAETARQGVAGERARLQSIVAHAPEGIFAVGPELKLEWLNETAARLTGCDPASAVGRSCSEVVQLRRSDGVMADHSEAFRRAARSGEAVHTSGRLRAARGSEQAVVVSYTAVADGSGGFEVGVGALRETEAAEQMDDRAADLGHELRSPLSTILGYARLMASVPAGTLDASRQAEFIGRITESGDYMLRLVNNLLDLRRLESGTESLQISMLQVESFLRAALFLIRQRAEEKRITTTLDIEPELPPVVTDELLARRAIDNLLSNAVKYTPEGGSISISAKREDGGIAIAVKDTGIGLTQEEQGRVFERFFRGTRPEARLERGTGLGLALVKEAARRLGGDVRVTSAVGKGSTFTLWLPLRQAPKLPPPPPPRRQPREGDRLSRP